MLVLDVLNPHLSVTNVHLINQLLALTGRPSPLLPQVAKDVDPAQAVAMAVANPQLAGRIIVELSAGETVAAAADKDSRKRARTEGAGAVV